MNSEKHILITGTSSGLGLALVKEFCQNKFIVHAGIRKEGDRSLFSNLDSIHPLILDVTNAQNMELAFQRIKNITCENGLSALINCAGVNFISAFEEASEERERQVLEVNLFGAMNLTRKFLPLLHQHVSANSASARVINVSSIGGIFGLPWEAAYHASKFAMVGWSESLHYELEALNISVCCFMPGGMKTNIYAKAIASCTQQNASSGYRGYYSRNLEHMIRVMQRFDKSAVLPERAAKAVFKLTQKNRMPPRYFFGTDAVFIRALKWLGLSGLLTNQFVVK